jgi:peptide/nickel transport system substrate-binding protein
MKSTVKKSLMLLLYAIMIMALASCAGESSDESPGPDTDDAANVSENENENTNTPDDASEDTTSEKDSLNVAVSLDSGTLDPIGVSGQGGFLNVVLTYMEPLVDYRQGAIPDYTLATGIDEVSDVQYTVRLREGVTFNNGNPFTAEDVLFSMSREKDHPTRMLDVQFVDFEKTKVVDDHTLDLWFTMYTPMNLIKMSQLMIVDAESFDEGTMSTNPVGTGPYAVKDYVVNSHVTVEARDDYWGDKPATKTINFKCLNETSQVTNALETGDVDYASISSGDAKYVESLGPYLLETVNPGFSACAFFNMTEDGPLGSKDARDAVSYAIDRESIVEVAYHGYATPVSWPISESVVDYEDRFANMYDTYSTGYNLDKARELAEKSGLVGKTVRIVTNGAEQFVTAAEIIQADFLEIGVTAEIINYDQATYFSILLDASKYEIALYATSSPSMLAVDIFANYPAFFIVGWNDAERSAYSEKGQDALITSDEQARREKLYGLVEDFYKYIPWYGVCDASTVVAVSKEIKGFEWWLAGDVRYQDWSF